MENKIPNLRIRRVLIELVETDEPGTLVTTMEVGKDTNYGWLIVGTNRVMYPRYVNLMSTISDFLAREK